MNVCRLAEVLRLIREGGGYGSAVMMYTGAVPFLICEQDTQNGGPLDHRLTAMKPS
jgi:hypothetical protein